MRTFLALSLLMALSGCPTSFSGSAHVAGGRAGCEQKCKKAKLRMSALVYLGEYSSACVCEVPAAAASEGVSAPPAPAASAAAGAMGAVVGAALHQPAEPDAPPGALKW